MQNQILQIIHQLDSGTKILYCDFYNKAKHLTVNDEILESCLRKLEEQGKIELQCDDLTSDNSIEYIIPIK